MGKLIEYGEGGYDPTKPNNNIVSEIETPDQIVESDEMKQIPAGALTELSAALADPGVNSIAEIKSALSAFISSIE